MRNFKISQLITNRKDASLGLYFKDVSKLNLISPEKEIELAKRIQKGDKQAENELIKANLRFVISVAKQYQNKGLDLVDLIQEGNCGLIEAARKYDFTKGYKFISYAVWWIRQAIMKAISNQCRTVRVPMNQVVNAGKVNKVIEKFEQENGRTPSNEEIEAEINLSVEKINSSLAASYRSVSLENPVWEGDVNCLLDVLPDETLDPIDSDMIQNDLSESIDKMLRRLPNREQDVLRMSFGIGTQQLTQEEIANRFGIGNERVRQIFHSGLKRMKKRFRNELNELAE